MDRAKRHFSGPFFFGNRPQNLAYQFHKISGRILERDRAYETVIQNLQDFRIQSVNFFFSTFKGIEKRYDPNNETKYSLSPYRDYKSPKKHYLILMF